MNIQGFAILVSLIIIFPWPKIQLGRSCWVLIGWTEIKPGAVQEPEEQPGSRRDRWSENYLARESRRITDGSSRARKKSSGRSAPRSFVRRGNRIFELNAARQARNLKMDFVICHSVWLRRRWARDSSSSRWSCLPIYHRPNFQRHYPATSARANATGTLINSIPKCSFYNCK